MSKAVKNLMIRDYKEKLSGANDALVISLRGVPALANNKLRNELAKQKIKVTVVRNALVKHAIKGTGLEAANPLLKGPTAFAIGESVVDVARELVKWAAQVEKLELLGAVLDGQVFEGKNGVKELSKFPTRKEAQAQTVTLFLSPARKLASSITGPGAAVASIIKSLEEKLEKGETIAKAG